LCCGKIAAAILANQGVERWKMRLVQALITMITIIRIKRFSKPGQFLKIFD